MTVLVETLSDTADLLDFLQRTRDVESVHTLLSDTGTRLRTLVTLLNRRNYCREGHELTEENVFIERRGERTVRRCKQCDRKRKQTYREKRRVAV